MIDRDRWNEVIAENSADTLENFCMLFPEPDAIPGDAPLVASMAVEFRGPLHGRFFVQAFGDVLAEATETLTVEETPDTMVTLLTGDQIVVQESTDVVVKRAIEYGRALGFWKIDGNLAHRN